MCNCIDAQDAMKEVITHAQKVINENPKLKAEVQGLLDLCHCEIEQGESAEHEIDLCWSDIDDLVSGVNDF